MIVVINGLSGAGKTFLLEKLCCEKNHNFLPIKKYTTRNKRCYEKTCESVDLVFNCTESQTKSFKYNYMYKNEWYGIDKAELESALEKGLIPVVIIRSFETIREIKKDFDDVRVIFLIGESGQDLQKILKKQGRNLSEYDDEKNDLSKMVDDYTNNVDIINNCILNYLYDEKFLMRQFFNIVSA